MDANESAGLDETLTDDSAATPADARDLPDEPNDGVLQLRVEPILREVHLEESVRSGRTVGNYRTTIARVVAILFARGMLNSSRAGLEAVYREAAQGG